MVSSSAVLVLVDAKNLERKVAPVNKFSAVDTTRAGTMGGVE